MSLKVHIQRKPSRPAQAETHQLVGVPDTDPEIPPISNAAKDGTYLSVQITAGEQGKSVRVYFRKESDSLTIVGVDRDWPGKLLADAHFDVDTGLTRYQELHPDPKRALRRLREKLQRKHRVRLDGGRLFQLSDDLGKNDL